MAGTKGFAAVANLARRPEDKRGGDEKTPDTFDRSATDALALWSDAYLDSLGMRNYSAITIKNRRASINTFMAWAADRDLTRAGQITRPILESFQRWLWQYTKANGQPLSWNSQSQRLVAIKDYFRWLTRQDVILHNPASELEMPRQEKRLPQSVLSLTEIEKLLNIPNVLDPLGIRDRSILELFYSTGIRRAELCHLELTDFNIERRTLHIRLGKGRKDRMVPVGEQAVYWLNRYLKEVRMRLCIDTRTAALFLSGYGGAFSPDTLSRMVATWMQRAGLINRGCCHILRHTCATHMLEGGADIRYIQQMLGHENLDTTAIYTEVSIKQLQDVHARCHPTSKLKNQTVTPSDPPSESTEQSNNQNEPLTPPKQQPDITLHETHPSAH